MVRKPTIRELADREFATIPQSQRNYLGITKTNFRKEFAEELRYVRKKMRRR